MKVGDKVLCKNNYDDNRRTFKKDNYYKISDFTKYAVDVDDSYFWFEGNSKRVFSDYFYTNKELRKIKLDEIERKITDSI